MQKIFNTRLNSQAQHLYCLKKVSVFIYSAIEYLVKTAPCYLCFEHTTTHAVLGKVIQFMSSEFLEEQSNCISLLLVCVSFTIIGQPRNSVLIRRV